MFIASMGLQHSREQYILRDKAVRIRVRSFNVFTRIYMIKTYWRFALVAVALCFPYFRAFPLNFVAGWAVLVPWQQAAFFSCKATR